MKWEWDRRSAGSVSRALTLALGLVMIAPVTQAQDHGTRGRFTAHRGFIDPQFEQGPQGGLLLLWAHPAGSGHDLHLALREQASMFADPVRVNDEPGTVRIGADEMRPSLAAGLNGAVAVAWSDTRGAVMVALGRDQGTSFDPPFALNQASASISPSHVVVEFDERGRLHATWIDFRHAEKGQTGPAHLYYARVERGRVTEQNITEAFTGSICANSRPALRVQRRGEIEFFYRNMDDGGGRDIYQVVREASGELRQPVRLGESETSGSCPPAGPVHRAGVTVWRDGSGTRLIANRSPGTSSSVIAAESRAWSPGRSPRFVETNDARVLAVFAPGSLRGRIYRLEGGSWKLVVEDVPDWCNDVAWVEGQILMVGHVNTEFRLEAKLVP